MREGGGCGGGVGGEGLGVGGLNWGRGGGGRVGGDEGGHGGELEVCCDEEVVSFVSCVRSGEVFLCAGASERMVGEWREDVVIEAS